MTRKPTSSNKIYDFATLPEDFQLQGQLLTSQIDSDISQIDQQFRQTFGIVSPTPSGTVGTVGTSAGTIGTVGTSAGTIGTVGTSAGTIGTVGTAPSRNIGVVPVVAPTTPYNVEPVGDMSEIKSSQTYRIVTRNGPLNASGSMINIGNPGTNFRFLVQDDGTFYIRGPNGQYLNMDNNTATLNNHGSRFAVFKQGLIYDTKNNQYLKVDNGRLITQEGSGTPVYIQRLS